MNQQYSLSNRLSTGILLAFACSWLRQSPFTDGFSVQHQRSAHKNHQHHQQSASSQLSLSTIPSESSSESSITTTEDDEDSSSSSETAFRRIRTYCVKGVTRRDGPLNEAVAQILQDQENNNNSNNNNADETNSDDNDNDTSSSSDEDSISLEHANELIALGAVWARMDALSEEELLMLYDEDEDAGASSRALYADVQGIYSEYDNLNDEEEDLERYTQQLENQRFKRVLSPSWMEAGTDIRIYPQPRRFQQACQSMTRETSLLYEDTTFIVVDKPPMLPTQPDSSNYHECCPGCVQDNMGPFLDILGREVPRPLLCHRVDACVGGCVVLSKDRNGQKVFSNLQRDRKLRKVYLAVTTNPVPLGMHLHWMWAPQSARGSSGGPPCQLVSLTPPESRRKARNFWNRCILEVVKCEPIDIDPQRDGHDYTPPEGVQHYQSTIRLVTGRKHQVRAQLAAVGSPIIRDTLYGPMAGLTLDSLDSNEEDMDQAVAQTRVPTKPIGLQAHGILFGGIKAKARTPWWGNSVMNDAKMNEGSS